uniref:Uncharacterized protein n=1 Tax=Arundo donax TaxID=35708 RepID=A0A0A9BC40_ARUDO
MNLDTTHVTLQCFVLESPRRSRGVRLGQGDQSREVGDGVVELCCGEEEGGGAA